MAYILIALAVGLLTTIVFTFNPIVRVISQTKAKPSLESSIFSHCKMSRKDVLEQMHSITNNRFSDDAILDYFYKIKGHQVVNSKKAANFWIKTYLSSPTKIKLNYFEQVKFYKLFLNLTKVKGSENTNLDHESKSTSLKKSLRRRKQKVLV